MSICGYHILMGEGLHRFTRGLLLALQEKAASSGRTMGTHLQYEADEIEVLLRFLEAKVGTSEVGGEVPIGRGFLGLVYLCKFLMGDLQNLASKPEELERALAMNVQKLDGFLQEFEAQFAACPLEHSAIAKTLFAWERAIKISVRE